MTDERRYGKWGGSPKGRPEDPTLCIEEVCPSSAYIPYQCTRKRGHGPDGLYCKQHAKKTHGGLQMTTTTDLSPNDLSHLSDEEFIALCPQGEHAPGPEPLRPIPVSERLPGPGDCIGMPIEGTDVGFCWCYAYASWSFSPVVFPMPHPDQPRVLLNRGTTHWLPSNALPLPEVTQ